MLYTFLKSFKYFEFFLNNPDAEAKRNDAHAALNYKTEAKAKRSYADSTQHASNSCGPLPQGYCG